MNGAFNGDAAPSQRLEQAKASNVRPPAQWEREMRGFAPVALCLFGSVLSVSAQNPVPLVNQPLVPSSVSPGGPGFVLTVNGTNFVTGAEVKWNGTPLTTNFLSASRLTAFVPAVSVAATGTASVTVVNPGTAVGSNVVFFPVAQPRQTITFAFAPRSPLWLENGDMPVSIAAGDFNGDGKLDLVLGISRSPASSGLLGYLSVLLGNGDGTFTSVPSSPETGSNPASMAVGDFNGDGKLDVAVGNYCSHDGLELNCVGDSVAILLDNGDGTFLRAPGPPVSVGSGPVTLAVGDFNADGRLDLAVANSVDKSVTILLGNGDGTFTPGPGSPVAVNPFALAVGDFDRDGRLDLAVANFQDNTVAILLGDSDGRFTLASASPVSIASPRYPDALAAGDFNGDGMLDLAVAGYGADTVTILVGNGDGTFTSSAVCCGTHEAGAGTLGIMAGDFRGSGRLDLAVPVLNFADFQIADYVTSFLANGDGTFTPSNFSILVPSDAYSAAVGDFNGDGKLDVATASNPRAAVAVLLSAPAAGNGPDFSIGVAGSTSASVKPGGSASYNIHVPSMDGFIGTVSLSCSSVPVNAMCSATPESNFIWDGATGLFTVIITTTAPSLAPPYNPSLPLQRRWPLALWAALLGLMFAAAQTLVRRTPGRTRALPFAPLAAFFIFVALWAGCGSGAPAPAPPQPVGGTPAGTYTITVTATSGNIAHATTLTLTVD